MSQSVLQTEPLEAFSTTIAGEAARHAQKIVRGSVSRLLVSDAEVQRFFRPAPSTPFPLEYAFHLLGDIRGATIVDLGCGDGVNVVVLASLGASVIALDSSYSNLKITAERAEANGVDGSVVLVHGDATRIPVKDGSVDRAFCVTAHDDLDWITAGRQIRRILKPGGAAVFMQPVAGCDWIRALSMIVAGRETEIGCRRILTTDDAVAISRAVGRSGRRREFMLTSRLLEHIGVRSDSTLRRSHLLDAWILDRFAFTRPLASPLVWEARKES